MAAILELSKDEAFVIAQMRNVKGFVAFKIEKRPTKEQPDGELVRIVTEISTLVDKGH